MVPFYGLRAGHLVRLDHALPSSVPPSAEVLWIDLFNPSPEEKRAVEVMLGLKVPSRQEMSEIEESSRLYEEQGAFVMTAVVISGVAQDRPARTQITFVLSQTHLVLLRYRSSPIPDL
jgi:magnesium transporter